MSNRSIIISHHHNTTTENIKKGWSPTTAQFVQENLPTVLDKSTSLFLYSKIENTFQLEILPCSPCKSHICWYFWTEKKTLMVPTTESPLSNEKGISHTMKKLSDSPKRVPSVNAAV